MFGLNVQPWMVVVGFAIVIVAAIAILRRGRKSEAGQYTVGVYDLQDGGSQAHIMFFNARTEVEAIQKGIRRAKRLTYKRSQVSILRPNNTVLHAEDIN